MPAHAVTLHLPDSLYDHFKLKAKSARRTVESELLRIVTAAAPDEDRLPPDLEKEISALESCSDDGLWRAARTRLSTVDSARLESLHLKQQDSALSTDEKAELANLLRRYERAIVIRAQAVQLLAEGGHDVSTLLED